MKKEITELTFADRDEYNRKTIAEKLWGLIQSEIEGISPVVIDGGFGVGKTEFCHKFINFIKQKCNTLKPIYINAFSEDHAKEPLLTCNYSAIFF